MTPMPDRKIGLRTVAKTVPSGSRILGSLYRPSCRSESQESFCSHVNFCVVEDYSLGVLCLQSFKDQRTKPFSPESRLEPHLHVQGDLAACRLVTAAQPISTMLLVGVITLHTARQAMNRTAKRPPRRVKNQHSEPTFDDLIDNCQTFA